MASHLQTFWIYYGDRMITAVVMPEGSTDHEVKMKALEDNLLRHRADNPAEHRGHKASLITEGHVKVFKCPAEQIHHERRAYRGALS